MKLYFLIKTDIKIYNNIVADTPIAPKRGISIIEEMMRVNRELFSFKLNEDSFSENIGISVTRRSDVAIAKTDILISVTSGDTAVIRCDNGINPNVVEEENATISADQKIACAGTGSPKKDVFWRVSILNLANRRAEKTGMANAESSNSLQSHDSFHDRL